jgi:hypothetical protein
VLLLFSVVVQDSIDQRPVKGDACNLPIDDYCIPIDMTFSSIRSIKVSSIDFSTALRSSDMKTRNQINRVGKWTLKVIESMEISRQYNAVCDQFLVSSNISGCKSGPDVAFDGLNKKHCNIFLQRVELP